MCTCDVNNEEGPVGRTVGPIELRAWMIASRDLATREGFPRKAQEINGYIEWITNTMDEFPTNRIHMVPLTDK